MIVAIGIDLVDINRIARAMRNPRFVKKILTERERERPLTPAYVAGRWAAKEAVHKCIGLPSWQDVEIVANESGAPELRWLTPTCPDSNLNIHLTISHEKSHAVAMVVVERINGAPPSGGQSGQAP